MSEPQSTKKETTLGQNEQKGNKETEHERKTEGGSKKEQNETRRVTDTKCTVEKETSAKPKQVLHRTKSSEAKYGDTTRPMKTPRITISEVVNSPSEAEPLEVPRGQRSTCHFYYGIKSYIHDFYHPPDNEVFKSGEYLQEDDFQFLVEPGKRRWRGWWLRVALWLGVNLMLVGIIAMLVGHLTTPRQTVVDQQDNFTVLDRWAVTFNNRLVICQLAGLAGFTSGAVIVMLTLLVSSYQQDQNASYYIMSATLVPERFTGNPLNIGRIPLYSSVRGVQPIFTDTSPRSSAFVLTR